MRIRAVEHGIVLAQNEPGFERAEGLHVSAIYGRLLKKLDPKRFGNWTGPGHVEEYDFTRMELGMSFEPVIERELKRRVTQNLPGGAWRPEPFVHMVQSPSTGLWVPLHYSPDLFCDDDGDVILGEIKLTWMSNRQFRFPPEGANHVDPKYDKWFIQIKAYCYMLGMTKCRLYVYWVCGDYTDKSPEFRYHYDIEFSARELHDNWNMLINFADEQEMLNAA